MKTINPLLCVIAAMLLTVACGNKHLSTSPTLDWKAGTVVTQEYIDAVGLDQCFTIDTISSELFRRMKAGKTWKADTPDSLRSQLRYLRMLHRNANGESQMGEMVVNVRIADQTLRIFRQLYDADYPIGQMLLMDDFDADDETAMRANNTSCFNFRFKSNSTTDISKHGYGLAIDLNTLYNPYVKLMDCNVDDIEGSYDYGEYLEGHVYDFEPATGEPYAFGRSSRKDIPMKIDHDDLAFRLFTEAGFEWGGDWTTRKDYQHFEMP